VARASFLIVFAAATSFHLPMEPLCSAFAIDQLMDWAYCGYGSRQLRSVFVIARWEGEFPPKTASLDNFFRSRVPASPSLSPSTSECCILPATARRESHGTVVTT